MKLQIHCFSRDTARSPGCPKTAPMLRPRVVSNLVLRTQWTTRGDKVVGWESRFEAAIEHGDWNLKLEFTICRNTDVFLCFRNAKGFPIYCWKRTFNSINPFHQCLCSRWLPLPCLLCCESMTAWSFESKDMKKLVYADTGYERAAQDICLNGLQRKRYP